jgi:ribosomal protein L22
MSDENIQPEATDEESVAPGEMNEKTPSATDSPSEASSVDASAAEEAEEKPKAARKPRAAKKADAAEAEADAATDAPAEKPKRARAAKPKAEEAEAAAAPKAEKVAEKPAKAEKAAPASKAKPAPRRRGAKQPEQPVAAQVVRAQAKYVRSSARKARLVCDNIRGKSVTDARAILAHTPRAVARDWSKLLESAVANAENNHELDGEDLVIKAVHADEGPTIKRFRPRAMGRATAIRKRTAHLTILLTPKN